MLCPGKWMSGEESDSASKRIESYSEESIQVSGASVHLKLATSFSVLLILQVPLQGSGLVQSRHLAYDPNTD